MWNMAMSHHKEGDGIMKAFIVHHNYYLLTLAGGRTYKSL